MNHPIIRPSRDADVPAVTAIYAHHVKTGTASFETAAPDEIEMRRRRAALLERRYPWLVAELDDRVCGYAYAGPYRTRPAYRHSVEDSVYVERAAHRRGIGMARRPAPTVMSAYAFGQADLQCRRGALVNTPYPERTNFWKHRGVNGASRAAAPDATVTSPT